MKSSTTTTKNSSFRSMLILLLVLAGFAALFQNGMLLLPSTEPATLEDYQTISYGKDETTSSSSKPNNALRGSDKDNIKVVESNTEEEEEEEEEEETLEDDEEWVTDEDDANNIIDDANNNIADDSKQNPSVTTSNDNDSDKTINEIVVKKAPTPKKEPLKPAAVTEDATEKDSDTTIVTTDTSVASNSMVVATLKSDGTYQEPPEGGQVVRIIVLTYARATSLKRLLTSLQHADYRKDTAHLHIWVDRKNGGSPDAETITVSKETCAAWKHGDCNVHIREHNVGLRVQWLTTWDASLPNGLTEKTLEKSVILEDDLEVSTHFWRWLRYCHASYGHRSDFSGCTLQRAALCAKRCPTLKGGPPNVDSNFMYPLVGSWGYSPGAKHWTKFTKWVSIQSDAVSKCSL